jgi:hypothetical protein
VYKYLILHVNKRYGWVIPTKKEDKMKATKHAEKRIKTRGFSDATIKIILAHGQLLNAPGGVTKVVFGEKECQQIIAELKSAIQLVIRAKNRCMIVDGDSIITAYRGFQ